MKRALIIFLAVAFFTAYLPAIANAHPLGFMLFYQSQQPSQHGPFKGEKECFNFPKKKKNCECNRECQNGQKQKDTKCMNYCFEDKCKCKTKCET